MVQILRDYSTFKPRYFKLKCPTKFDGGMFLGLRYKKQPFYFQTPKLIIPFGISKFGDAISFSLEDIDIDPKIKEFLDFLKELENYSQRIFPHLKKEIQNHLIGKEEYLDSENSSNESSDGSTDTESNWSDDISFGSNDIELKPILRETQNQNQYLVNFKLIDNKTVKSQIYDGNKMLVDFHQIKEKSYGICIVQALGFWVRKEEDLLEKYSYGLSLQIQQMKIDHPPILDPFTLIEDYSCNLNSNNSNSNQPPPPPPLPSFSLTGPKKNINLIIQENKAKQGESTLSLVKKMYGEKEIIKPPSLNEILNKLSALNKVPHDNLEKRINLGKIID